ncbi:hypothetical protein PRUPE_2G307700 [Prunus persica]|uniref:Uncharacterized protein n=1 Tax=Prunus persica TaxID=3760 RepID=A0A251QQ01_PRUPE|nr:hypothetical protein PRUPE_2G307700 [Prunus persica]
MGPTTAHNNSKVVAHNKANTNEQENRQTLNNKQLTIASVIRKKSTEEFSCVTALLNCLLYTCYALPVVSYRWENFLLVTINGFRGLLEFSFIFIYFWFSTSKGKMKVAVIMIPVIIVFCITAIIPAFVFHDHHHRTVFVGSVALVPSVAMYAAPLVVVDCGILQLVLYCT